MATTISANIVHIPHNVIPSSTSASSSSTLQRSQSSSSSSTAHPMDSTESSKDEKASSSVSSSPTYQSNSSSSHHKTISTAVSSTNTAGSISPPPAQKSHSNHRGQSMTPLTKQSEDPQSSQDDYTWDRNESSITSRGQHGEQSPSEQELMSSSRLKKNEWSYERFNDDDDDNDGRFSPFADEAMPMQYPPISEEEKEAKAIEMNLERWASQERQRRKALRTSRTASVMVSSTTRPNKITKRLSALNPIGPKSINSSIHNRDARMSMNRNNSDHIDGSWSSSKEPQETTFFASERQASGDNDQVEEHEYFSKRSEKGKEKEGNNPFSDPVSISTSPIRRRSMKPTPRAPIVTPGKAPTIRHRALINAINSSGGTDRMPSIVATDADEEKEAVRQIQELAIDPFQSAAEIDQQRQYIVARDDARKKLLEGDIGAHHITPPRPIMAPNRKSTSSSKFNEIGLNDDDDAIVTNNDMTSWLSSKDYEENTSAPRVERHSRPYWVQYLCGWAYMYPEDDEEQSGRTFPE